MSGLALPSGYKRLEYIESTGTQYVNTGVYISHTNANRLKITVDKQIITPGQLSYGLDGTGNAGSPYFNSFYVGVGPNNTIVYGDGRLDKVTSIQYSGNRSRFTYDAMDGKIFIDDKLIQTFSFSNPDSGLFFYLFGYNRGNSSPNLCSEKIWLTEVVEDGVLTNNYIPCINENGQIGLYDEVSSEFHGNAGTGSFIAGPIIYVVPYPPNPPTNLDCEILNGSAHLSWSPSLSEDVIGYKVYQNGVLIGSTPYVYPLFEFPFSNDSLTESLLEFSELRRVKFDQKIDPRTHYEFSVTAYNSQGESDPISINVYYETYLEITAINLVPNPVSTGSPLTVSAIVNEIINSTIT